MRFLLKRRPPLLWTAAPLVLALLCWPTQARAEWFYVGAHLGGQVFDLDTISGGQIFDQSLQAATESLTADGNVVERPQPTHYSSAGSFVWGAYMGISLGRLIRLGARFTHSWMEVTPEGGANIEDANVSFDLSLFTILGELQVRIPIRFVVPFVGMGFGFAYLKSDTTVMLANDESATSELGTPCFDAQGTVGIDFNIGSNFSLGGAATFSFIAFYYEDPKDPLETEAAWGFIGDFLIRATLRI